MPSPEPPQTPVQGKDPSLPEPRHQGGESYYPNDGLDETWNKIISILTRNHPALAATLSKSSLVDIIDTNIVIQISGGDFIINRVKKEKNMSVLKSITTDYFKKNMELSINPAIQDVKEKTIAAPAKKNKGFVKQDAVNHPLVSDALEILNGKIVNVKII